MKKSINCIALFGFLISFSQNITGNWNGILKIPGAELKIIFSLTSGPENITGTMSVPQQGAKDIPLTSVFFEDNLLKIAFDDAKLSYLGELNSVDEFEGTFTQMGQSFPMKLTRKALEITKPERPQEPKAPFPYRHEDVTFQNQKEHFSLAGTLTLPEKGTRVPAVVLISGSGPQDRNSEIFGHKPFWLIADELTRNGIAVLRIDDRGVGDSQGNRDTATSEDFATDVEAALAYLKTRKEINPKKIGLIGHSEGGMIAPIVASRNRDIHFIILLAGPGIPGDELLLEQAYTLSQAAGMSEIALTKARQTNLEVYNLIKKNPVTTSLKSELTTILKNTFSEHPPMENLNGDDINKYINSQVKQLNSPWFRYFVNFKPAHYLEKVKCPVLVLNGEKDLQVSSKSNTQAIAKALEKGGNKKVTVKVYPRLNHLFQECETGTVEEYAKITQTFSPEVLTDLKNWILMQTQ